MSKSCLNCYFGDKCYCEQVCEFYCPIGEEAEDEAVCEFVEQSRAEFYEAWFEYIEEYD
ncbi:MAG: hypothetical protein J6Y20_10450 [Lachnospiraceae bacterium]|nr:hypothetical protein [Lachnospiraceae bacterium]